MLYLEDWEKGYMSTLTTPIQHCTGGSSRERYDRYVEWGRRNITVFADDMIVYVENVT